MNGPIRVLRRFVRDDRGLESVEYAVMVALISTALIIVMTLMTDATTARFDNTAGVIDTAAE